MIGPIDFIVSFIGENSGVLARVFFGTLGRHCDLGDVTFHLVRKQVSNKVWGAVLAWAMGAGRPLRTYELDTGWAPYKDAVNTFSWNPTEVIFNDAGRTAEWCVDNCGCEKWCILSHFDVVWCADIVQWLVGAQEGSGAPMVGSHCPVMLLDRVAYHRVGTGFGMDSKYDVGVELGRALGAVPFPPDPEMEPYFHHLGGGGGYQTQEEFDSMRGRALLLTKELEL